MILIDGGLYAEKEDDPIPVGYYFPSIATMIGLGMLNILDYNALKSEPVTFGASRSTGLAKGWLFVSLCILFGSFVAAIWISVSRWFPPNEKSTRAQWPGLSIILNQVILLVTAVGWWWIRSSKKM
jgi:hypothetical protein